MPGEKKKESKTEEGIHIVEIIFGILILLYLLDLIGKFIAAHLGGNVNGASAAATSSSFDFIGVLSGAFSNWVASIFPSVEFIAIFLSLIFFMGIIYALFRLHYLEKFEKAKLKRAKLKHKTTEEPERFENVKWQRVLDHVNSQNPNDWRLAILEGDILLGDILEKMGYRGEGIGEMLKSVEKSDFNTIDNAWEAHKIRNAIAHEGADFILTQREAKRAVGLYESVFHEFHFI